eukprot:3914043-Prymnesium_polylepis.1
MNAVEVAAATSLPSRPAGEAHLAAHPEVYPAPIGMVGRYSLRVMRNWGHFEWLDTYLRKEVRPNETAPP